MARMSLSLETLKDFDYGKAAVAWEEAAKKMVQDLLDRPGVKATRSVTLVLEAVPVMQQDGDVVEAEVEFKVSCKTPPWKTPTRPVTLDRQGRLIFNDMAPDEPHQTTIDEA